MPEAIQIGRLKKRCGPGPDFSYNGLVGQWWLERAADGAHQRAYRNIANFIRDSISHSPRLIVDYACGAGNLLSRLSRRFPHSRLVGLDGSSLLLDPAQKRVSRLPRTCAQRISLIETSLPVRKAPCEQAELVVYCFPNMIPFSTKGDMEDTGSCLSIRDRKIAERLSKTKDPCDESSASNDSHAARHIMEYNRSISRNLRRILVRGGICVRAEYATTRRHEWSALELLRVAFEEGSLDTKMDGMQLRPWFRVLASAYYRSRVMEDVFQQTGDTGDTGGGYLITVLRAI